MVSDIAAAALDRGDFDKLAASTYPVRRNP